MLRIDHVFTGSAVEVTRVHVPQTPLARAASDHLPLVVDFEVR
jgi:endonuclease/exonuclease/phosphatase family metal-dependent hydrolase